MIKFYSYYRRNGTAKSTHLRNKGDYANDKDNLGPSEKPVEPESAVEDGLNGRQSIHLVVSNHSDRRH